MATLKFYLREASGNKATIFFRYRTKAFDLKQKTPFSINPEHWDDRAQEYNKTFFVKGAKSTVQKKLNNFIEHFNQQLQEFRVDFATYMLHQPDASAEEIKNYIQEKYFPEAIKPEPLAKVIPENFSDFIDYYIREKEKRIEGKQEPITEATRKKLITIKNRLKNFNPTLEVKDIDDDFRDNLTQRMQKQKFSSSTIIKDLKYIKTICSFASKKKLEVNSEVLHWEFMKPRQPITPPVLSFAEIDKIKNTIYPHDYLENAKDWLIIGCYTGARVSDLMNFSADNIVENDLLTFRQKKTQHQTDGAEECIWLHPEVLKILARRNGQFPRKISDVKFNDYIKKVCKIAGINQKMIGGIKDKEAGMHGKKITGEFEKWELVSSHICRRSFVTNYIGILGKDIKTQTGHRTDAMVDLYDKTQKIDKAMQIKEKMKSHLKIV